MKKDIYIIKNKINNKVYIGQAKDSLERWYKHKSEAKRNKNNQVISKAMRKYGFENFWYEILEFQIENYDEREQYWIQYYNSLVPNGYNVAQGGNSLGIGLDSPNSVLTQDKLHGIIHDIIHSKLSFKQIAQRYQCCSEVISSINNGVRYKQENLSYPLRKTRYEKEIIKQVIYSLKYEYDKTIKDISNEYHIEISQVNEINQGRIYYLEKEKYPLRKGKVANPSYKYLAEIKDLLKNTTMLQKDIAKKFNVSASQISSINKGLSFHEENENYPLRDNYQGKNGGYRKSFSPNEILEIEKLLIENKISLRKIALDFETGVTTIMNINNGTIKRYKKDNYKYPLRNKK